jgi:hypothetical protein
MSRQALLLVPVPSLQWPIENGDNQQQIGLPDCIDGLTCIPMAALSGHFVAHLLQRIRQSR